MDKLRIGLVGGGPWAHRVHAAGIAAHAGAELAGVWARRPEARDELTRTHGGESFASVDALLDAVDAVAFAVPPAVQAEHAVTAAARGKHLILEKPLAATPEDAERIAAAVDDAAVASLVMLTRRFTPEARDWLAGVHERSGWQGGYARWLSGALLDGEFATSPWRHEGGALADIGPHVLDLLDAALGPIVRVVAAARGADDLWQVLVEHEGGCTSTVTMSLRVPASGSPLRCTVVGESGTSSLPERETPAPDAYAVLLDELTGMVAAGETRHPCDVHRGVHLQRLLRTVTDTAGMTAA